MANRVQTLRSSTTRNVPATGTRQPGELWTNFPDLQIGVIDASQVAQKFVAVRYFSTLANYVADEIVVQAGAIWIANGAITAGVFNASQWTKIASTADVPAVYVLPTASTTTLGGVKIDGTSILINSGVISSAGLVSVATTPPVSPQNGALWFDLVGGQLYAWVNDGNSSQWVIAVNSNPAPSVYLPLAGGTLTGALGGTTASFSGTVAGGALVAGNGGLMVNAATAASGMAVVGSVNASLRWGLYLGNGVAEGGGNVGSNLQIYAYSDTGAYLSTPMTIVRSTGAVTIKGVTDGSDAGAGNVGEVLSIVLTTPLSIASGATYNIIGLTLTAGDWDVTGELAFLGSAPSIMSALQAGVGPTSGGMPSMSLNGSKTILPYTVNALAVQVPITPCRVSLSVSTNYWLLGLANFASGTVTATGKLWARRAR